ncbi:MAG TPA: SHOCT domain-containing protein, partial [Enhygromyxa sp.]|nr:SHOCT domain-containing protein [Enhygromyxa sp.]
PPPGYPPPQGYPPGYPPPQGYPPPHGQPHGQPPAPQGAGWHPAPNGAPPPAPAEPQNELQVKLQKLKAAYEAGLLTDEEYSAKKATLLDTF